MSTPVRDLRTGGNVHQLSTRVGEPVELRDLDSALLLQGQREVRIRHGNEIYRLRHTRNDKLILTK
ncbi:MULTISPECIES: hemin uptake protein HemP [Luteimonas]|uniref:hemin uptake protein HemP n=1 Tax=Luteimonas TaxID=83614 RepID=UPI001E5A23E1|nr:MULTISPECIES: hemin uptake protein HemP [Luteimonas]